MAETTRSQQQAEPRLPQRTYELLWHWRGEDPHGWLKRDEIKATTVPRACKKLERNLKGEYADVAKLLVIVSCEEISDFI